MGTKIITPVHGVYRGISDTADKTIQGPYAPRVPNEKCSNFDIFKDKPRIRVPAIIKISEINTEYFRIKPHTLSRLVCRCGGKEYWELDMYEVPTRFVGQVHKLPFIGVITMENLQWIIKGMNNNKEEDKIPLNDFILFYNGKERGSVYPYDTTKPKAVEF